MGGLIYTGKGIQTSNVTYPTPNPLTILPMSNILQSQREKIHLKLTYKAWQVENSFEQVNFKLRSSHGETQSAD